MPKWSWREPRSALVSGRLSRNYAAFFFIATLRFSISLSMNCSVVRCFCLSPIKV